MRLVQLFPGGSAPAFGGYGESMSKSDDIGQCYSCNARFSYFLVHNGFNDSAYAYCDTCGMTSLLSGWSKKIPEGVELRIHQVISEAVEPFLQKCFCGGSFKKGASPRCPRCSSVLSAVEATKYIEANAPGARMGWRWQQDWQGVYCITVEGRVISDNWKEEKEVVG